MPLHRKPTHRPKILAAVLGVAATISGVAVAAQVGQDPVRSAPGPDTTLSRSSSPTSGLASVPEDHAERDARPSRSTSTQRARLAERPERSEKDRSARSTVHAPSPTLPSETVRSAAGSTPTAAPEPGSTTTSAAPTSGGGILGGTNAARADAGLPSLRLDSCLAEMAQRHARRLAGAGRLYHQDLGAVMGSCGMSTAGENVAMNYTGPSDMVDQWLKSPGHRANLLSSRFSLIGVGVAQARDGAWYGVQVFGDR